MATAFRVETPIDFERTLGGDDCLKHSLCSPDVAIEPEYRAAIDEIFNDLQFIDSSDPQMVSAFLNGIAYPLNTLRSLGFVVFAITTTGTMTFKNDMGSTRWKRVYYLIVPANGFFRISEELSATVHRFDPHCHAAVSELAKAAEAGTPIAVWSAKEGLMQQLERNVPWCVDCCFGE